MSRKKNIPVELCKFRDQAKGKAEYRRALALIMSDRGYSVPEIVAVTGLSRTSVYRLMRRYLKEGIEAVREPKRYGRPVTFDQSFLKLLDHTLAIPPPTFGYTNHRWTLHLLSEHLGRISGKKISLEHLRRLRLELKK